MKKYRYALQISLLLLSAMLTTYIIFVAKVKVDFISAWPIVNACGLAPALVAASILLFFRGSTAQRALCIIWAGIFLLVTLCGVLGSVSFNMRKTVLYSDSPGGTHRMAVVQTQVNVLSGKILYPIFPASGIWYHQTNVLRAYQQPTPEDFRWLDESTVEITIARGTQNDWVYHYRFSMDEWELVALS